MPYAHREIRAESLSRRNFDGERFDAVCFVSCDLARCRFNACDFTAVSFAACDLSRAIFEGCRFEGAAFTECDLGRTTWTRCSGTEVRWADSSLVSAAITDCLFPALAVHASDLKSARIENCMLEGARLDMVLGPGARFMECNLVGAAMEGCQFRKGTFGAGLWDLSRLTDCDLRHCAFSEICAAGVQWERLLLEEASFHDTTLAGTVQADDVNPLAAGLVLLPDDPRIGDPPSDR